MFAPHARVPARSVASPQFVRTVILLVVAMLSGPPGPAHAGSPWERASGTRKDRALPPIPQAREAASEPTQIAARAPRPAPIVALLDFDSTTLSSDLQDAFAQALWAEFYQSPATQVLPRKELRRYLFAWDLYPHQPVGRQVSVAQTAEALKADYLIHGHINQTEGATMLDYRVYSSRLGAIITKNNDVRTGSLRDMALIIPDLGKAMLAAIDYAEDQESPVVDSGAEDRTELLAGPQPLAGGNDGGAPAEVTVQEPVRPADPRAEAAAEERERVRRLEEAHRAALTQSSAAVVVPPVAADRVNESGSEGVESEKPEETAPESPTSRRPRPTELAMVSPIQELAPVESPGDAAPSTARVSLEPVRRPDSASDSGATPAGDEVAIEENYFAKSDPEPAPVSVEGSEAPIDMTSREAAREAYEKSRSLPPQDAVARIGLLEQAAVLDPTETEYAKSLALAYYKAGRYKDCIEASRKAAKLAPEDSIIQTILGSALFESGRFEEARNAHERSLELDPSNLYARFNLALTLQALGSPRALAAWGEFLELSKGVAAQAQNRERALQYYDDLKAATR